MNKYHNEPTIHAGEQKFESKHNQGQLITGNTSVANANCGEATKMNNLNFIQMLEIAELQDFIPETVLF